MEILQLNISKFNFKMSDEVLWTLSCGKAFFIISNADMVFSDRYVLTGWLLETAVSSAEEVHVAECHLWEL